MYEVNCGGAVCGKIACAVLGEFTSNVILKRGNFTYAKSIGDNGSS